ncbi:hypothetical protein HYS00_00510 [Candidatus Microgenomates bacterium]|nr:hypothetical protein [Candidatus Microgenomates bacterium]
MTATLLERPPTTSFEHAALPSPESPVKLTSIDDYFSIENEIDFVDKVKGIIPEQDTRRYIEDDMYKFLGEFAGKVPYTTIRYKKTPSGLDFAGLNLSDSYQRAATNGDREHAEWVGYDKIQQGLIAGKKTAKWISPAKIADYGFLFHFQQDESDPEWINEYILRYDEPLGTTDISQGIMDRLSPDESYNTAEQFLYNPVIEDGFDDPKRELMFVLKATGISDADIERSFVYEAAIKQLLSGRVDEYTNAILSGDEVGATQLRNGIFAAALEIAANLDKPDPNGPGHTVHSDRFSQPKDSVNKFNNDHIFFGNYASQEVKIEGGGSCPAIRKNSGNPFSANDIRTAIATGTSIENLAESKWDYDKPGTCRICEQEFSDTQAQHNDALGPCALCKDCEKQFNQLDDTPTFLQDDFDLAA